MIFSWWSRRAARHAGKINDTNGSGVPELTIPINYRCPISLDLMRDPITLSTGITYDRESIEKWIENGNQTCPITNRMILNQEPIPNHAIRKLIQNWCVENQSYGVERIPTPRVPVSSLEISEILAGVAALRRQGDSGGCLDLVAKIKNLAAESERNRRRLVDCGAARSLSEIFEAFSESSMESSVSKYQSLSPRCNHQHGHILKFVPRDNLDCQCVTIEEDRDFGTEDPWRLEGCFGKNRATLGETLSALTMMLPLDEEAKSHHLGSFSSLNSMVLFLKQGDLSERRNAALVMKEIIVSSYEEKIDTLIKIEGAMEALVKLVKEPICTRTTKASLTIIFHMVARMPSLQNEVPQKFVDLGLVPLLLEMLLDSDTGICERALAVLDRICDCDEGREEAYFHALSVPVLVKKILRVTDLATGFSISVLWKVVKREMMGEERGGGGGGGGDVVVEALQVGAFQKLLLVLQVGCGEETKEKASELLKVLNLYRDRVECIDPMDFKNLKRSF